MLILGTCKYITLHGKENIADVIKLSIFRWKDFPELSIKPSITTGSLYVEEGGCRIRTREGDLTRGQRLQ